MLESLFAFFEYIPDFNDALGGGILIFVRFLGFLLLAPIIGRKEIPALVKIPLTMLLTVIFVGVLKPEAPPASSSLVLSIFLNFVFGSILGFIANVIFATINAAGDMMNMQMGLSSAVMFDPSTRSQSSVLGRFFSLFGIVVFMHMGGLYWMFDAFARSFEVYPLYATGFPIQEILNLEYLSLLTANVLYIGLQIAAPVLLATLGMDIILGIISKTAPQVNVFQLSFLFKPLLGAAIMVIILPMLYNIISDYFSYYSMFYG